MHCSLSKFKITLLSDDRHFVNVNVVCFYQGQSLLNQIHVCRQKWLSENLELTLISLIRDNVIFSKYT